MYLAKVPSGASGQYGQNSEKLEKLVARLRKGDKTVCNEIIEGHTNLIWTVARRYARMNPSIGSVFYAEALYALTMTVSKIMIGRLVMRDNNITPYLVSKVHSHLSNVSHSNVLGIAPRTIRKHRLRLKQIDCINTLEQPDNEVPLEDIEELKKVVSDPLDLQILLLKFERHTDREIVEILGISMGSYRYRLSKIQRRYLAIHE